MTERKSVDDLQMLQSNLVTNVKDRHGCTVSWSPSGWKLFGGYPTKEFGPFSYEVVSPADEENSGDLRNRVARLENSLKKILEDNQADVRHFDEQIVRLGLRVDDLEQKASSEVVQPSVDNPEVQKVRSVLSEVPADIYSAIGSYSGATYHRRPDGWHREDGLKIWHPENTQVFYTPITSDPFGPEVFGDKPHVYDISEVPDDVNLVYNEGDRHPIHRLAVGGWILGYREDDNWSGQVIGRNPWPVTLVKPE